ncbi:hypothetical protein FB45DRAFT_863407 [Roridomyces roridus]|uniref:Uncharacterized protein n=1 Tax=Roridomyces roridus TaxID=1738132 RepID=A0AAD7C3H8_9AGAR|nr:hypothetical protein FB45DRAFT_863407 [Roridomyces roridus]
MSGIQNSPTTMAVRPTLPPSAPLRQLGDSSFSELSALQYRDTVASISELTANDLKHQSSASHEVPDLSSEQYAVVPSSTATVLLASGAATYNPRPWIAEMCNFLKSTLRLSLGSTSYCSLAAAANERRDSGWQGQEAAAVLERKLALQTELCGILAVDLQAQEEIVKILAQKLREIQAKEKQRVLVLRACRKKVLELHWACCYLEDHDEHLRDQQQEAAHLKQRLRDSAAKIDQLHRKMAVERETGLAEKQRALAAKEAAEKERDELGVRLKDQQQETARLSQGLKDSAETIDQLHRKLAIERETGNAEKQRALAAKEAAEKERDELGVRLKDQQQETARLSQGLKDSAETIDQLHRKMAVERETGLAEKQRALAVKEAAEKERDELGVQLEDQGYKIVQLMKELDQFKECFADFNKALDSNKATLKLITSQPRPSGPSTMPREASNITRDHHATPTGPKRTSLLPVGHSPARTSMGTKLGPQVIYLPLPPNNLPQNIAPLLADPRGYNSIEPLQSPQNVPSHLVHQSGILQDTLSTFESPPPTQDTSLPASPHRRVFRNDAREALSQLLSAVKTIFPNSTPNTNVDRVIAAVRVCVNVNPTETAGVIEDILRNEHMAEEDIDSLKDRIISLVLQHQLRFGRSSWSGEPAQNTGLPRAVNMPHSSNMIQGIAPESTERFYITTRPRVIHPAIPFTIFESKTTFSLQHPPNLQLANGSNPRMPPIVAETAILIQPGDIYIHRNSTSNVHQAWVADLGAQWVDATRGQHVQHPRLNKVLLWRASDGLPSWVSMSHFNSQLRLPQTMSVPLRSVVSAAPGHSSARDFWA